MSGKEHFFDLYNWDAFWSWRDGGELAEAPNRLCFGLPAEAVGGPSPDAAA